MEQDCGLSLESFIQNNLLVWSIKQHYFKIQLCGSLHRLENHQDIPLEIIEIQTGSYLGEDDIIRFEDDYQRN